MRKKKIDSMSANGAKYLTKRPFKIGLYQKDKKKEMQISSSDYLFQHFILNKKVLLLGST